MCVCCWGGVGVGVRSYIKREIDKERGRQDKGDREMSVKRNKSLRIVDSTVAAAVMTCTASRARSSVNGFLNGTETGAFPILSIHAQSESKKKERERER